MTVSFLYTLQSIDSEHDTLARLYDTRNLCDSIDIRLALHGLAPIETVGFRGASAVRGGNQGQNVNFDNGKENNYIIIDSIPHSSSISSDNFLFLERKA